MGGAEVMVLVVEEGREGREGRGGKGSNGGSDPVGGSDMAICYLGKRGGANIFTPSGETGADGGKIQAKRQYLVFAKRLQRQQSPSGSSTTEYPLFLNTTGCHTLQCPPRTATFPPTSPSPVAPSPSFVALTKSWYVKKIESSSPTRNNRL